MKNAKASIPRDFSAVLGVTGCALLWAVLLFAGLRVSAPRAAASAAAPILAKLPACALTPYDDEATGLTGYRDARGRIVVAPRFALGEAFGPLGVAPVVQGRAFGYIDCKGRFFETLAFDSAPDEFHEGLVRVRQGNRIGYANLAGHWVIAPRFESAAGFCRGVARVGEACTTRQDGEHTIVSCLRTRYIDTRGRFVPEPEEEPDPDRCDAVESTEVVDAVAACDWTPFSSQVGDDALEGYRDSRGRIAVAPRFTSAGAFDAQGLAPVLEQYSASYLDCSGNTFSVMWNDGPDAFSEGLVRYEGKSYDLGYRNRRGQIVIPAKYAYASPFCEGVARVGQRCSVERNPGKSREITRVDCTDWQLIDRTGRRVAGTIQPDQEWACGL